MNKILEITREQFSNFQYFAAGMYRLINKDEPPTSFNKDSNRFFIVSLESKQQEWTDLLFIIDPYLSEFGEPVFVSCDWWILDCSRDTTEWPEIPTEATHVAKGRWCGVKWFTMDYVTGYDGEDFVEEMARDMKLLREVLKLCGANEWDDMKEDDGESLDVPKEISNFPGIVISEELWPDQKEK